MYSVRRTQQGCNDLYGSTHQLIGSSWLKVHATGEPWILFAHLVSVGRPTPEPGPSGFFVSVLVMAVMSSAMERVATKSIQKKNRRK